MKAACLRSTKARLKKCIALSGEPGFTPQPRSSVCDWLPPIHRPVASGAAEILIRTPGAVSRHQLRLSDYLPLFISAPLPKVATAAALSPPPEPAIRGARVLPSLRFPPRGRRASQHPHGRLLSPRTIPFRDERPPSRRARAHINAVALAGRACRTSGSRDEGGFRSLPAGTAARTMYHRAHGYPTDGARRHRG